MPPRTSFLGTMVQSVKFPNRNKGKDFYGQGGGVLISMKHILTVSHLFFAIGELLFLILRRIKV